MEVSLIVCSLYHRLVDGADDVDSRAGRRAGRLHQFTNLTFYNITMPPPKEKKKNDDDPPLSAVERLQSLNLVSRIAIECAYHLGIFSADRTLAVFIINLAERRIKSFLREQFVNEGGSLFHVPLLISSEVEHSSNSNSNGNTTSTSGSGGDAAGGGSSKLRISLISSAIEHDIDTISAYRDDLITNGAGDTIHPTFAARILRTVCDMSPRMERVMKKMEEKKRKTRRKQQQQLGNYPSDGGGEEGPQRQ